MQRKTLILLVASVLALCGTAFLVGATPAQPGAGAMQAPAAAPFGRMHRRDRGHGLHAPPAVRASVLDLRAIERLYRADGKSNELPGFYRDVLAKTRNPMLRNYVYLRLARLESAPANTDAAIATLRQSLDENLKLADRMEAPR
jgi:hypothetical protein